MVDIRVCWRDCWLNPPPSTPTPLIVTVCSCASSAQQVVLPSPAWRTWLRLWKHRSATPSALACCLISGCNLGSCWAPLRGHKDPPTGCPKPSYPQPSRPPAQPPPAQLTRTRGQTKTCQATVVCYIQCKELIHVIPLTLSKKY